MPFDDPALVAEFVTESREHLADVEGQLLEIEAGGANVDVDLVNTVFRAIHSVKGAAGFLGFESINKLAHSLENVLGKMRTNDLAPTSSIVDVMLRAADQLAGLINDIEHSNKVDVSEHVVVLDQIFETGTLGDSPAQCDEPSAAETPTSETPTSETPTSETPDEEVASSAPTEESLSVEPSVSQAAPQESQAIARATKSTANAALQVESSIRVQVGVLDSLMNLAGELVLARNQLLQTINSDDHAGVQAVGARVDQVTGELQEAIMQTRMQPIGNVFGKFPRVVRDLSAKLNKQCEVILEGKDVEVDKTIIEAIGDPLTHLVRNSIDHGVETPSVRAAAGKNPAGKITLRAYHQAGKVRIDIIDDGGGIDPEKLKKKAVSKGILSAEQAADMTEREAVRLIFHPGFSMAEKISDVSGRGVGMDVVRTNIDKIGGNVDVESTIGVGTSIQVTLPLTLAIIPSMLIRSSNERFAVPQANIVELVRVRASELSSRINGVNDAQVLRLRGNLLPLVRLDHALGIETDSDSDASEAKQILVVEYGPTRYGLIVDTIDDSEEIVVKPLGQHLKTCSCLAGATILGDGHVAPILDVAGIAARCNLRVNEEGEDEAAEQASHKAHAEGAQQSLLLFTNASDEHFAVPMSLVDHIERIRTEQIDNISGQDLLRYETSTMPLLSLERFIDAKPREQTEYVYVVVFKVHGRDIGLIAPELKDICDVPVELFRDMLREDGVAGTVVFEEATIRMLELFELTRRIHPEWFKEESGGPSSTSVFNNSDKQPTIVLAEDSGFFRKQLRNVLSEEGFTVMDYEDGQEAWNALSSGEHEQIDLVITDIEMPRMDGLELSRRVKRDPALRHLPVIALTSLASDEDQQRGVEAGVDDYQIKMQRDRLIKSAWELIDNRPKANYDHQPELEPEGCLV